MVRRLACDVDDFVAYIARVQGLSSNTVRAYEQHLEAFARWVERAGADPYALDVRAFRRYLGELSRAGYAARTVNAHVSAVRSFYRWLVLEERVESAPVLSVRAPKVPKSLPRTVTSEELDRLFAAIDDARPDGVRDRAMLELMYATGARISELAGLAVADLDCSQGLLRLLGKGSKERIVPVYRRAVRMCERYLSDARPQLLQRPAEAFFVSRRGAMDAAALRYRFSKLVRAAGLPSDVTPHTMRHTFATDLLAGGADLRSVQELLGHASLSTTQLYTHLTPDRLKDAVSQAHPRG